jgi:hypothetical protein
VTCRQRYASAQRRDLSTRLEVPGAAIMLR